MRISLPIKFLTALILLCIVFLLALMFGSVNYSLSFLIDGFLHGAHEKQMMILTELRLPRNVAAVFVGAALGISGTIMQAITRNPLADPGLLGVSAGANAALAVVLAFLPGLAFSGMVLACFIGAALGTLLVLFLSQSKDMYKIVLAGAAISAFLTAVSSGIGLIFKTSKGMNMWTSGGLIGVTWNEVWLTVPIILATLLFSLFFTKQIGILTMSDEVATGLGLSIKKLRVILLFVIAVLTGLAVSLIGDLAFVGLIVPHFARFIVGANYKAILPMSAFVGAFFLLLADIISRTLNPPFEIPIIAIISVIGFPFFLYIVRKGVAS
ncbi:FecCD family ABC transporter permease [Listeria ilorinensis]|uniref:FecCD family ABC transporter permease n=1 Tax=Listeria ilorinensis TaxID=2867439 RepID=UPI001EF5CE02|nr:iron ABC transporter permease [Listeria ilorinensis]